MMGILDFFKGIFKKQRTDTNPKTGLENMPKIYAEGEETKKETEIISIWDVLKLTEHTQAYHLVSVISFDEWISMDEIRRRIWDLFQIDYKNERSLYPYLKTMVDIGLIETSNIGGKRKWRKKDLLVKIEKKKKEKEEIELKQTA